MVDCHAYTNIKAISSKCKLSGNYKDQGDHNELFQSGEKKVKSSLKHTKSNLHLICQIEAGFRYSVSKRIQHIFQPPMSKRNKDYLENVAT